MSTATQQTLFAPPTPQPIRYNGKYTVRNRQTGEHRTFRISTVTDQTSGLHGKRILSLLSGPDNERNYTGFAFVLDSRILVWRKRQGLPNSPNRYDVYAGVLWDLLVKQGARYGAHYDVLEEKRCVRCNRTLTTPESIESGIGPVCSGIIEGGHR